MNEDPLIQAMVERIALRLRPLRIILFGSHARGTADGFSDVDLLVVLREAPDKHRIAVQIRRELSDLPVGKDILVATADEVARRGHITGTALRSALLEGEVVYESAAS